MSLPLRSSVVLGKATVTSRLLFFHFVFLMKRSVADKQRWIPKSFLVCLVAASPTSGLLSLVRKILALKILIAGLH